MRTLTLTLFFALFTITCSSQKATSQKVTDDRESRITESQASVSEGKSQSSPTQKDALTWGRLDETGKTYVEKTAIRQANWKVFKQMAQRAMDEGKPFELRAGHLELEPPSTDKILVPSDNKLHIKGKGDENTHVYFYPLVKRHAREVIISTEDRSTLIIEGMHFTAIDGPRMETYSAKLNPDLKSLEITSKNLRPGFLRQAKGKRIFVIYDANKMGLERKITAVEGKSITLDLPLEKDFNEQTEVLIGVSFPQDISQEDYEKYGQHWYDESQRSAFISHKRNHRNMEPAWFELRDSRIERFSTSVARNGGNWQGKFINSYINGHVVGISSFSGKFENPTFIEIDSLVIENCGFKSVGIVNARYVTAGLMWGGGGYIHNNVVVRANKLYLLNNNAAAWRQYSGSGRSPIVEGAMSFYKNCVWKDNAEYGILASNSMPTTFENCLAVNSRINLGRDCTVKNSHFENCGVSLSPHTDPGSPAPPQHILLEGCTFVDCRSVMGWRRAGEKTHLEFKDCVFIVKNLNDEGREHKRDRFFRAALELKELSFVNCTVKNNLKNPKGVQYQFAHIINVKKLNIINTKSDSFDKGGFVYWRKNRDETPIMNIKNSQLWGELPD